MDEKPTPNKCRVVRMLPDMGMGKFPENIFIIADEIYVHENGALTLIQESRTVAAFAAGDWSACIRDDAEVEA